MYVYCLFCRTQRCKRIAQLMEIRGVKRAFSPQIMQRHRKQGQNLREERDLLPGYVFIFNDEKLTDYRVFFGIDGVIRRVGRPEEWYELQGADREFALNLLEKDGLVGAVQMVKIGDRVKLDDPFQPFLRPSDYSRYTADSRCVKKATDLAQDAKDQVEIVSAVYAYVNKTVRYDHMKAATVQSGYLPDPDETLKTRRGICFDYASLAAAMLRSQGVPCKVIFGYVAPNQLYHAWNMFYTEETGWVTVSFKANGKDWTRMDLTFTANGQDDTFIGNGSNYTDLYFY